jgi:hypothetical protein
VKKKIFTIFDVSTTIISQQVKAAPSLPYDYNQESDMSCCLQRQYGTGSEILKQTGKYDTMP